MSTLLEGFEAAFQDKRVNVVCPNKSISDGIKQQFKTFCKIKGYSIDSANMNIVYYTKKEKLFKQLTKKTQVFISDEK